MVDIKPKLELKAKGEVAISSRSSSTQPTSEYPKTAFDYL